MDENKNNDLLTPSKLNSRDFHKDISFIYGQLSPNNSNSNNGNQINGKNKFMSKGTCVTSTPVNRPSFIQQRKSSSGRPKRHSIKPDNDDKRVDITEIIKTFEENLNDNETILNDIHLKYVKFKYSRLNRIDTNLSGNEELIYMYPALFNANIMSTKFVDKYPVNNVYIAEHRYDCDRYALKIGKKTEQRLLSQSSLKIIHELRILKLLAGHPHVVEYCDSWMEKEVMILQIKYMSGGSLFDHIMKDNKIILSGHSVTILFAQIGSVLAYLHDHLCLAHGALTSHHILVELAGYTKDINGQESAYSKCHEALIGDNICNNIRFKLCDFGSCCVIDNPQISGFDILSFGLILYQCFGCDLTDQSDFNLQIIHGKFKENISQSWRFIIMNMCNSDLEGRWTAKSIIAIDGLSEFILPEARSYLHDQKVYPVHFLEPFRFEGDSHLSVSTHDNFWIKSQVDDELVDVTPQMKMIELRGCFKEKNLNDIHENIMKFKSVRFNRFRDSSDLKEKCIYNYPFLFNCEAASFKFSTQTLISETKLSMIYIVYHRFDGDRYILKVGLPSLTTAISESSHEIINEMHILKLIGHHPNVVDYYDCWFEQEKFHLQLEFVSGGSLYDFLQGHFYQFRALSDVEKQRQKHNLSKQSAYILLAHIASVLVFLHDELRIYHGDIKPSNILIELCDCVKDDLYQKKSKYYCHEALSCEEINRDLRFKLCDFGRSGPTVNIFSMDEGDGRYLPNLSERDISTNYHDVATSRDIFSLGLTIYDCFCGLIDRYSGSEIRSGSWGEWPETITEEWRDIIKKLSHLDIEERMTAREIIALDKVQPFVLPEALYHLQSASRYIDMTRDTVLSPHITEVSMEINAETSSSKIPSSIPFDDEMDVSF